MIFETTDLSFFFGLEKDAQCTLGWDIYDFFVSVYRSYLRLHCIFFKTKINKFIQIYEGFYVNHNPRFETKILLLYDSF